MCPRKKCSKNLNKLLTHRRLPEIVWLHTVNKNTNMRTKTLVLAAAITAAGLASSMAQSNVYSLNVVGYVNVPIVGDGTYNLLANPLNNTSGNNAVNLFQAPLIGNTDQILTWDVNLNDFTDLLTTPTVIGGAWNHDVALPPGKGFFYVKASSGIKTNTFVGEVVQGSTTNLITGLGTYNLVGSTVPLGGNFTNSIAGLVPAGGDEVLPWDESLNDFRGFAAGQPNWNTGGGGSWNNPNCPIEVGRGFFYVRAGANHNWVRTFNVPTP